MAEKRKRTLRQVLSTCQSCKKESKSTRERRVPNADYQGPCGDSFCYASCDIDSCTVREYRLVACDACAKKLGAG